MALTAVEGGPHEAPEWCNLSKWPKWPQETPKCSKNIRHFIEIVRKHFNHLLSQQPQVITPDAVEAPVQILDQKHQERKLDACTLQATSFVRTKPRPFYWLLINVDNIHHKIAHFTFRWQAVHMCGSVHGYFCSLMSWFQVGYRWMWPLQEPACIPLSTPLPQLA